jgi:hypothetical protein
VKPPQARDGCGTMRNMEPNPIRLSPRAPGQRIYPKYWHYWRGPVLVPGAPFPSRARWLAVGRLIRVARWERWGGLAQWWWAGKVTVCALAWGLVAVVVWMMVQILMVNGWQAVGP